jgi:hypothetical protein
MITSSSIRRLLAGSTLLAGVALVPVVLASPASATVATPAGCAFHLGNPGGLGGAAGSEFYGVPLIPDSFAESCTTTVTVTAILTANNATYTDVIPSVVTETDTVTFTPGQVPPDAAIVWHGFSCADPAVPGTILFAVTGAPTAARLPVTPQSCAGTAPSSGLAADTETQLSPDFTGIVPSADGGGYQELSQQGFFNSFGDANPLIGADTTYPAVAAVATASGQGDWIAASNGGVFTVGDAGFFGSAADLALAQPIVGMAVTPDGGGYWLVAADGGVFTYGDAAFYGSTGNIRLNSPIVGIAPTADGHGYWLVAADGGVFAFGDAGFEGSLGSLVLNAPIVGMATDPATGGYWLVAADGGIFSFGAPFFGSAGDLSLDASVAGMAPTPDHQGYWLVGSDGGIFTYGDATFYGTAAGHP